MIVVSLSLLPNMNFNTSVSRCPDVGKPPITKEYMRMVENHDFVDSAAIHTLDLRFTILNAFKPAFICRRSESEYFQLEICFAASKDGSQEQVIIYDRGKCGAVAPNRVVLNIALICNAVHACSVNNDTENSIIR
jgi:hypothetical protein